MEEDSEFLSVQVTICRNIAQMPVRRIQFFGLGSRFRHQHWPIGPITAVTIFLFLNLVPFLNVNIAVSLKIPSLHV